ncbi:MAG TPA: Lsr2 family protein [Arthrobacter sp.]
MAQRIQVLLVDDLDGSEASQSIHFSVEKTDYVIDLSDENADEFRAAMDKFVGAARKTDREARDKAKRAVRNSNDPAPAAVRAWAQAEGLDVSPRGRVKAEIIDQYLAANAN